MLKNHKGGDYINQLLHEASVYRNFQFESNSLNCVNYVLVNTSSGREYTKVLDSDILEVMV